MDRNGEWAKRHRTETANGRMGETAKLNTEHRTPNTGKELAMEANGTLDEKAKQEKSATVVLDGVQRFWLLNILPREGRAAEMRALRAVKEDLVIGDEEMRDAGVDPETGNLTRAQAKKVTRAFTWLGEPLIQVRKHLRAKEEAGKLPAELLSLFEQLCE
jgi:hypothetical protein